MSSEAPEMTQEGRRLAELARYRILDTPREVGFDDLAALASEICGTPIAVVNLIARERQWFKAEVGLGVDSTPLDTSFCSTAILEEDFLLVPDATKDNRFACNPLVTGDPGLRFYAGALLKGLDGSAIGTLCVLDYEPRSLSTQQQSALKRLARQVMAQLDLRLALIEREEAIADLKASEARFRAAVDAVQGVLWTNNPIGEMEGAQPGWAALTGQTAEQYQGYGWASAVHPDDAQSTVDAWNAAVTDKKIFVFEHRVRRSDGEWRRFSIRAIPTLDADGRIKEWVGVHTDVTVQRQAEEELRDLNETLEARIGEALAERRLLADLVEGTDAFVQVLDADYRWLAVNKAAANEFERIYGVRPKVGASILDLLAAQPEHRDEVRNVWARALGGEEFTQTGEFGDPGRDRRFYEMKYNVLRGSDGHQIAAYQFVYDVTERTLEQAALATAEEALRQSQKLDAIGQLTGGVAHDFNNLLTVIRGSVDLLRLDTISDAKRAFYINAIGDTADRAAKLTSQLLSFARRQSLSEDLFDVEVSLSDVANMLQTMCGSGISLSVQTPVERYFILADRAQFDTAIVNLGINARDAMNGQGQLIVSMAPASGIPTIRGHGPVSGEFVAVTIADTGAGIPLDHLDRIFEPFFTTKGVGEGTGLGLSQVIGFAKQSGGDVRVGSTSKDGTAFTLYLPRADPVENAKPQKQQEPAIAGEGAGTCVLVVEDNHDVGVFAAAALAELGYESVLARDAQAALNELAIDAERFNIVFSDVVMPGTSGIELAGEIRRLYSNLPIILTSGYSHVLSQSASHGFELLHKPYSVEQLARVLNKAVTYEVG